MTSHEKYQQARRWYLETRLRYTEMRTRVDAAQAEIDSARAQGDQWRRLYEATLARNVILCKKLRDADVR